MSQPDLTPADTDAALITKDQAATILGVTPRMVHKLRTEGELPYVKVGKLVRFRRSDIDEYIQANLIDRRAVAQ